MRKECLCIQDQNRRKRMASAESTGTSNRKIKGQYENMKSMKDYCRIKIGGDME